MAMYEHPWEGLKLVTDESKCELCGEPMPAGEEMFKFHGYSGPCPKPPLERAAPETEAARMSRYIAELRRRAEQNSLKRVSGPDWSEHVAYTNAANYLESEERKRLEARDA